MTDYELEQNVAKTVMGWNSKHFDRPELQGAYWVGDHTRMILNSPIHKARLKLGIKDDKPGDEFVFAPITDSSDWMQIVKIMKALGYVVSIYGVGDQFMVSFDKGIRFGENTITDKLIGRAVCLTALLELERK